ncbi:hypothetical protein CMV30_07990 [Nibricoccus aquaticus]|uniref:Uncharacterized protein n=1 Tax=Nibricoccus aquaticus TaxID=2576891 RepID=A0A290Q634_9BACT|nr:hypothetical protein [Nibricoccus aquaticus]ATC63893.1 hypothetical protein CMV30_07990 [Nibricoccus aquaticus]
MSDTCTLLDEFQVRDLEDNSTITIIVEHHTEIGNRSQPGLMVRYMGQVVNFEPCHVERWAYQATKAKQDVYFLADYSWAVHADQFVKNSLVLGDKLKARVEVKVRSKSKPVVKEYELPFTVDL